MTRAVAVAVLCAAIARAAQPDPTSGATEHLVPDAVQTGILINIPQRLLFVKNAGEVIARYPVGLGRPDWPTFVGSFTVVAKEVDPVWEVPVSIQEEQRRAGKPVVIRVGPGPTNPLGKHWLGLSVPGYGIHGTTAPSSISRFQSHGCIRLLPEDIADLFARVNVGTEGEIVYEPVLFRAGSDGIVIEAHEDVYGRRRASEEPRLRDVAAAAGVEDAVDWQAVRAILATRDGQAHRVGRRASAR